MPYRLATAQGISQGIPEEVSPVHGVDSGIRIHDLQSHNLARSPAALYPPYLLGMARQKGLEPLAYCLEGSCSILLSYWRKQSVERVMGIEPT